MMIDPLCPPKPKLFDNVGPGTQSRGSPITTSIVDVVAEHLGVGGRGDLPLLDRQQHGGGFERAGGAERMTGDALGRHDRHGSLAEHRGDRRRLGRVVERCARAVGVDLSDVAGLEPGVGEREPHAGDRADTAGRRRGDVVGVGVAAAPEDLAEDRAPCARRRAPTPRARTRPHPHP